MVYFFLFFIGSFSNVVASQLDPYEVFEAAMAQQCSLAGAPNEGNAREIHHCVPGERAPIKADDRLGTVLSAQLGGPANTPTPRTKDNTRARRQS